MAGGKPFVKGDSRINRKGRPATGEKLRALIRAIGYEQAFNDDGEPELFNGRPITMLERIAIDWAKSKDSRKQELFVKYGWGSPIEEAPLPPVPIADEGFDITTPPAPDHG